MAVFTVTQVLSGRDNTKAVNGGVAVVVNNPLSANYLGLPPKGTLLTGPPGEAVTPHCALSVAEDGTLSARAVESIGAWETAQKVGAFLVFSAWNDDEHGHPRFLIPFSE